MNILFTNDDGVKSVYTLKLAGKLSVNNKVTIVVPKHNSSGTSHSVSFYKKIYVKKVSFEKSLKKLISNNESDDIGISSDYNQHYDNIELYAVTGTPADCVKVAHHIMTEKHFDLVISGVNDDLNIGTDVYYSGTVGAAMQARILGYPSVAVSIEKGYKYFEGILDGITDLIFKLYNTKILTAWNINIPPVPPAKIEGIRFTKVGADRYRDYYVSAGEKDRYILSGDILKDQNIDPDSDVELIDKGFITITPLTPERSDYSIIDKMKTENFDL